MIFRKSFNLYDDVPVLDQGIQGDSVGDDLTTALGYTRNNIWSKQWSDTNLSAINKISTTVCVYYSEWPELSLPSSCPLPATTYYIQLYTLWTDSCSTDSSFFLTVTFILTKMNGLCDLLSSSYSYSSDLSRAMSGLLTLAGYCSVWYPSDKFTKDVLGL